VKTKYCNDWTRKTPNINMNKKPLLQVDSSKVSGIHAQVKYKYITTTKVYKYLATADVEIRNFRKIRFSPVKILILTLKRYPTDSYPLCHRIDTGPEVSPQNRK
jgi:hypothetical protein